MNSEIPSSVLVIESSPMILAVIVELAKSAYPTSELCSKPSLKAALQDIGKVDVVIQNLSGSMDNQRQQMLETVQALCGAKSIFLTEYDESVFNDMAEIKASLVVNRVMSFQQILLCIANFDEASAQIRHTDEPANEYQSQIQYPGADKPLTHRQVQALELAVKGFTVKQIAREMGLSTETVKSHLKQAYERLKARNRAQGICNYLEAKRLSRMLSQA